VGMGMPSARSPRRRPGDLALGGASRGAGLLILLALAGVGVFLAVQGLPAWAAGPGNLRGHPDFLRYVWPLVFGTVLAATLALLVAVPLSIGVALAVSHYAPRRIGVVVGYLVDGATVKSARLRSTWAPRPGTSGSGSRPWTPDWFWFSQRTGRGNAGSRRSAAISSPT
jgi:hypothetical protein